MQVVCGDGAQTTFTDVDAVLVNAGVTMIPSAWVDALTEGGRMLLPLTFSPTPDSAGTGVAVVFTRASDRWDARIIGVTQIYPCAGARDASGNAAIHKAMMKGRWHDVRTLRRDRHDPADSCWCHLECGCLSYVTE